MSGCDEDLEDVALCFENEKARRVQHSIDHLNGELIYFLYKNNGRFYFDPEYRNDFASGFASVI